ncbi:MAG: hypothetical protein OXB88_04925, partial [Bacteriovoracales bacterium]|nr:hypothetical protein [Bacteriovoracales bacterium]
MSLKEKRAPSLIGKISIAFSIFVVACVVLLMAFSFYQQRQSILDERRVILNAFGQTISSTIERPFSLGDYSEVQSLLAVEKLPDFINSIKVLDRNNIERASDERRDLCAQKSSLSFTILNGGVVAITSSNCDLKERFFEVFGKTTVLAILIIIVGIFLGQKVITWAWNPAKKVIEAATNSKSFTEDLINVTDKELRPLISLAFNSYKRMADSELQDEMLHNLASPVKTLRQIFKKSEVGELSEKDSRAANNSLLQIESYMKTKYGNEPHTIETFLDDMVEGVVHSKKLEFASTDKKRS